ncbi:MAG TPA: crossover junction endodeoxyribonuclease RuvC [Candidatus Levybacteria bacterium]|nr:crossover junction endodeoxyribonuclease RuvC [Candidatus Levybacteria bacterium]
MRIIGIDPGIARVGWGVVEEHGNKLKTLNFGCFETPKTDLTEHRLLAIYEFLTQLFAKYQPDALSVEELFFNTNTKTALIVGQARGVVLMVAAKHNITLTSFTPLQVKMALTGYGRADKSQIGHMVKTLLYLKSIPKPDDTADALAIAITHAFTHKLKAQSAK